MQSTTALTGNTYPLSAGAGFAALGPSPIATQLDLEVWNQPAVVQLLITPGTASGWGDDRFGDEFVMSSQAQSWQNVYGFHAKSAISGQPATVRAKLYETTDSQSTGGNPTPLQGQLLSNGIVAPKVPLFSSSGIALTSVSSVQVPNTLVGSWQYLLLAGTVSGNNGQIDCFYSSLDALTNPPGTVNIDNRFLIAANPFVFLSPVMGDVVQIQANGHGNATMTLYVTGTNTPYRRTSYSLEQILNGTITGLAQNSTAEVTFLPFTGLAQLYVQANSAAPNYNIRTKCYDIDQTTLLGRTLLGTVPAGGSTGDFESQVWLPPTINTVAITNLSATAGSYNIYAFAQAWGGP